MQGWVGDIEADNLYLQCTKIWYIRLTSLDGLRTIKLYPFQCSRQEIYNQLTEWIDSFEDGAYVVFHNGLGFDFWALWKLIGIIPRVGKKGKDWLGRKHVQFVDTYVLSMYLSPDNVKHSLEFLASGSEDEKMDFRQKLIEVGSLDKDAEKGAEFRQWHPLMEEYCDDDVKATRGVFKGLWSKAIEMYGSGWLHPSFRQMQKDYWLYSAQAYSGSCFNQEKAKALTAHIEAEMTKLKDEVDPKLPPRELKSTEKLFYKFPSKPFSKSGERSSNMIKWLEKHNATMDNEGMVTAYGITQKLVPNGVLDVKIPMEISDNVEIKQYFLDAGWKPSYWNTKKGPDGKPERDSKGKVIPTTPKIQEAGQLCPNLLKLNGEIPAKVVKFLSYRNRYGVVNGWLSNWRLAFDGRISSEISGYTPTFRAKHKTVVNCPKADPKILLGYEMRDLFNSPEGYWYIGSDCSGLENRTVSAYTYKHDNGEFAKLILEGDCHTYNVFAFFPETEKMFDINEQGLKDRDEFKPYRNKAKVGAYLLAYGGGIPKLASSLNLTVPAATIAYNNYWVKNPGLGKLKDAAEAYYNGAGKKKYLPAWDGRILSIRSKNKIINCLGQSLGAISMSIAMCMLDTKLGELYLDDIGRPYYIYKGKKVWRTNVMHDEVSLMAQDGIHEEIRAMTVECMVAAGEFLKLPVPLDGEGKMAFQGSWKNVH